MLHIKDQNDACIGVTEYEFEQVIHGHSYITLAGGAYPVFENNDAMINSYLMISPSESIVLIHSCRQEIIKYFPSN